jgi:membrane-bound serine protease (ClpP class)
VFRRLLLAAALVLIGLSGVVPAFAGSTDRIDVVVVDGMLDGRMVGFVIDAVESSDAQLIVLQLDSPATLDGDLDALLAVLADPPLPVTVWAGPDPATVSGGALRLLAAAGVRGAAPGVVLGPASPTRAGSADDSGAIALAHPDFPEALLAGAVVVDGDLSGYLDLVVPSIGQFVVGLDGLTVAVGGSQIVLETATEELQDGVTRVVPSVPVTFIEPGIIDRTIRLGATPEAAFFFLVAGLALVAFEFYAAGPGMAATAAAVCLLLGGYGIAVLPVRWWAVALVPFGLILYTIDFQRNDLGWKSLVGTAALVVGGLFFTDAAPQIEPAWWVVVLVVVVAILWFGFALTTVVRSRFSTQTIGRDHLIGRRGVAASAIEPDGTVIIDGARWRARSSRTSGIAEGDPIDIVAVEGIVLEVDPVRE